MTEIKDNIYNHSCNDNSGNLQNLSAFEGQALLIVNTASKCGFTPQYNGLQELQEKFKDSGFSVLAFPCNQFGGQEPGSSEEIQEFCTVNYGINFPIFEKVDVKGEDAHPLFKYLTSEKKGLLGSESIKWNFTKFLIDKEGKPIARFAPNTTPDKISKEVENLLND